MILITVVLRGSSQLLQFHFDSFKNADAALNRASPREDKIPTILRVEDDYGSKACVSMSEVAGILLTDLEQELKANEKCQMAKIELDIRIQKNVQQNPGAMILKPKMGLA